MKSLDTIQKLSKIGRVLSKIAFLFQSSASVDVLPVCSA